MTFKLFLVTVLEVFPHTTVRAVNEKSSILRMQDNLKHIRNGAISNLLVYAHTATEQDIEQNLEKVSSSCDRLTIHINKEPRQKKQSARM